VEESAVNVNENALNRIEDKRLSLPKQEGYGTYVHAYTRTYVSTCVCMYVCIRRVEYESHNTLPMYVLCVRAILGAVKVSIQENQLNNAITRTLHV